MSPRPSQRSRVRNSLAALADASTPVFLVSADRRILYFNAGCQKLTRYAADEVIGQVCEYLSDPGNGKVESLAASLCPPSEAFEGKPVTAKGWIPIKDAEPVHCTLWFLPIVDDNRRVTTVLGSLSDDRGKGDGPKLADEARGSDLHAELGALRLALARRFATKSLVCRGDAMLRIAEQVAIARETSAGVLITGERGTGKEHLARSIHYESKWRTRSFVPLDCRRLSALELEQTLRRLLDPAREDEYYAEDVSLKPGTLFLAHVELLPRDVQQFVVQVFREKTRGSAGGTSSAEAGLRLIASSSLAPEKLCSDELLRSDFFHLISPLTILVPPLRSRGEDLKYLAQALLEELNRGEARQLYGFADDVWEKLMQYSWPGNVAELFLVIQEARAACNEPRICGKHLPFRFRTAFEGQGVGPPIRHDVQRLAEFLEQAERSHIESVLKQCRRNKTKAAELLGLNRARLSRRMQRLGILDEDGKGSSSAR